MRREEKTRARGCSRAAEAPRLARKGETQNDMWTRTQIKSRVESKLNKVGNGSGGKREFADRLALVMQIISINDERLDR